MVRPGYRADIDGLRAVAVAAVVGYHAVPAYFPGGFIGVDVFFVVSGFLISGIVLDGLDGSRFSLVSFYHRRVKRLFPALAVVMLFCLAAGWIVLLPTEYAQLGKHLAAGAGFVSNLVLLDEARDYFDKGTLTKPLRHLWSLGIEEQFYLLFPPALMLLYRKRSWVVPSLVTVALASFALNVFLVGHYGAIDAFYNPITRAWELLMGALVGRLRQASSHRVASAEGTLGLLTIGFGVFCLSDRIGFPGTWALVPTVGTAFVIHAGASGSLNARVLSLSPLRRLGVISYPLYLWHWPLLAFATLLSGGASDSFRRAVVVVCVVLSYGLADLTYRFIESPFHTRRQSGASVRWSKAGSWLCCLMASIGLCGAALAWRKGLPARSFAHDRLLSTMALYDASTSKAGRTCPPEFSDVEYCTVETLDRPVTDVLLGDSHANHLYPGLADRLDELGGRNLLVLARSGTPPLRHVGVVRRKNQTDDAFLEYVAATKSVEKVYLGAFWSNYSDDPDPNPRAPGFHFEEPLVDLEQAAVSTDRDALVQRGLERTLQYLTDRGKRVVVFLDVPRLPFQLSTCLPRPLELVPERFSACSLAAGNPQVDHNRIRGVIQSVVSRFPLAELFDPASRLCVDSRCKVVADGIILYSDEHHLSIDGAKWLFREGPPP